MHLLGAENGIVSDGSEPIDPNQSPADIVFISAADTEIACLSLANGAQGHSSEFLRLAQLTWLAHPFSVDLYIEKTAQHSRMVIIRALGGISYWQYCLEQFAARLRESGTHLVCLPGDDRSDEELFELSTVNREQWELFWAYCVEGGIENASNLLKFGRSILDECCQPTPPAPRPLLRSGYYWPNIQGTGIADIKAKWTNKEERSPIAAVLFYRALLQSGGTEPIDCLIEELQKAGINPLPIYVTSLKDPLSGATLDRLFAATKPGIVINLTSFAIGSLGLSSAEWNPTIVDKWGGPVLQAILSSQNQDTWDSTAAGLSAKDIAMHLALPEIDGRLTTRAIAFKSQSKWDERTECPITLHKSKRDRVQFVAALAAAWVRLQKSRPCERRIAILLANYPSKDGRIANGVGLDTPASAIAVMGAMKSQGYQVAGAPTSPDMLMKILLKNRAQGANGGGKRCRLKLADYLDHYRRLPLAIQAEIEERWGYPEAASTNGEFNIEAQIYGNLVLAVQPSRGYDIDPELSYHSPDLPPPHHYLAFYFWLRCAFQADAVVHLGKHGNLEWLPGKSVALSSACFPEAALGPMPNIYPFIVNDPGEGTQAKRRTQAVIIDHLTPPMTRAETYGNLREIEMMMDEYYQAAGVDPKRVKQLQGDILAAMQSAEIDGDAGIDAVDDADSRLRKLDAFLCEIKESQIRDGLHVLGVSPAGAIETDLLAALARIPRGDMKGENASLLRALAADFELGEEFDPLDCEMARPWQGPRPVELQTISQEYWRSVGDTIERLELFSKALIEGSVSPTGPEATEVLAQINQELAPRLRSCGDEEIKYLLKALDGQFVAPGPSGAPSRGRPDVLPTGRNFYSVDSRAIPTPTAWTLGWKSASLLIERHLQDHGDWPRTVTLTAWGTSNMRTGGDDIAQALALMGVQPVWDSTSHRVTGVEAMPYSVLGRPRLDVTLRVSGFFRDAFPYQMDLVARAAKLIMALDEPAEQNPAAANYQKERSELGQERAGFRVFGSKPGAYGAGLQAMIDQRVWDEQEDLGESYIEWGGYAYGASLEGEAAHREFRTRLAATEIVVQNQDNREHDLLDSDDYYQFEGGAAAAIQTLRGSRPVIYHNDHSRPERPVIRTLDEEVGRVVRARVVNPKWINGVQRHGYKGAFEIAATVDYMFAFAATTGAVKSHHFDLVYIAYLQDDNTREFIANANPPALREIAERLNEAIERGIWKPKRNSVHGHLLELIKGRAKHQDRSN